MLHIITNFFFQCGRKGHWSRIYNTDKQLVDLYYTSKKRKRKIKTNLVNNLNLVDLIHLDVSDFFEGIQRKNGHIVSDGNIHIN